jgi:hypothetical protein
MLSQAAFHQAVNDHIGPGARCAVEGNRRRNSYSLADFPLPGTLYCWCRYPNVILLVGLVARPLNEEVVSRGACPSTIPRRVRFEVSAGRDLR